MIKEAREIATGLVASDSEEMRHLGDVINELCDDAVAGRVLNASLKAQVAHWQAETDRTRAEYLELFEINRDVGDSVIEYKRERDAYREALINALEIIGDWAECDEKAQHTNTIDDIVAVLHPVSRLPEDVMKIVREVLADSCEGGQCDPES